MNRHREIKPWGFSAFAWQGCTFALAGLLAITNAAWFYNMRVARTEAAAARPAPLPRERVIYQTPDGRELPVRRAAPPAPSESRRLTPLADDERCIDRQRFKRTGNGFVLSPEPC